MRAYFNNSIAFYKVVDGLLGWIKHYK